MGKLQNSQLPRKRLPRGEREKQMLDSAAALFARKGFHATSMEEIARESGITKPMLYAYFDSKEGLYAATVDRSGAALVESVSKLLTETDPLARINKATELLFGFLHRNRDAWSVLFSEGVQEGPVAQRVASYREHYRVAAARTLARAGGADMPGPQLIALAEPYAAALLGGGEALARWWLTNPDRSLDEALEIALSLVSSLFERCRAELIQINTS